MGGLIKFLLIMFIILFVLNKAGKLLRTFMTGGNPGQAHSRQRFNRKEEKETKAGNLWIKFNPKKNKHKRNISDFKGGEYVDYEEVD